MLAVGSALVLVALAAAAVQSCVAYYRTSYNLPLQRDAYLHLQETHIPALVSSARAHGTNEKRKTQAH